MSCNNLYDRHWFTEDGMVGLRRSTCVRCGAPNPKWSPAMAAERAAMVGDQPERPSHAESARSALAGGGTESPE